MISQECKAAICLTGYFGKLNDPEHPPLKPTEWAELSGCFSRNKVPFDELLSSGDTEKLLADFGLEKLDPLRVGKLLERSFSINLLLEKWSKAGVWFLSKSSPDYPKRLVERLGKSSPPVLYGFGSSPALLGEGGVAVVGPRNAGKDDLAYCASFASDLAGLGHAVISGGARGTDREAMTGALAAGGRAVGVLAGGLLREATSSAYRESLMSGSLVLVSPYSPEAGFHAGRAMARNHHVYCLADSAVVVSCEKNAGGTWRGAADNLRARWRIPLWVGRTKSAGNAALAEKGAKWLPEKDAAAAVDDEIAGRSGRESEKTPEPSEPADDPSRKETEETFFGLFMSKAEGFLSGGPRSSKEIHEHFGKEEIPKTLVSRWLRKAAEEGLLEKKGRPVRYSLPGYAPSKQLDLF